MIVLNAKRQPFYFEVRSLLTFFTLSYLISWTIWSPLYGHIFGLNNLETIPYHHGLGALGPLVASIVTTCIFLKTDGLKSLIKKCVMIKPVTYLLIAFFMPFLLLIMASGIDYWISGRPINFRELFKSKEFPALNFLSLFFYNLLFFGFGEEVGWRGFALPLLQAKASALMASIILTIFWALWHLPLFFYRPGYVSMTTLGMVGWVLSLITGSVLLTWFYNSSRGSILICAVFHSTIDIAFTANVSGNAIGYMGFLVTLWGVLIIIFFKPKNLSRSDRETLSTGRYKKSNI